MQAEIDALQGHTGTSDLQALADQLATAREDIDALQAAAPPGTGIAYAGVVSGDVAPPHGWLLPM